MAATSFVGGFDLRSSAETQRGAQLPATGRLGGSAAGAVLSCSPVDRPRPACSSTAASAREASQHQPQQRQKQLTPTPPTVGPSLLTLGVASSSPHGGGTAGSAGGAASSSSASSMGAHRRRSSGTDAAMPLFRQVGFEPPASVSASLALDSLPVPPRAGSPLSVLERGPDSGSSCSSSSVTSALPRGPDVKLAPVAAADGSFSADLLEERAQEGVRSLRERRSCEVARLSPSERLAALAAQHPVYAERLVTRAFHFAYKAHEGQLRKSGEPYFNHVLETSLILTEMGFDATTVAAALLHDTLDDTMTTHEMLVEAFGAEVANLVARVSRLSELSQMLRQEGGDRWGSEKKSAYGDVMLGMSDVRAVVVKLADRLHNLRTIEALPAHKQQSLASETLSYLTPLANRLGMWCLKAQMEDICFRVLHPRVYEEVRAAAGQQEDQSRQEIMTAIRQLSESLAAAGIECEDISGRPKNLYSMWTKMCDKGLKSHEILDQRALRIILKDEGDCYAALRVVEQLFTPIEGRLKDYIGSPKLNGYQSIHTSAISASGLPLEVQIRTVDMHYVAEYGLAAHWRYKERASAAKQHHQRGKLAASGTYTERQVAWARFALSMYAEASKCRLGEEGDASVPSFLCPFQRQWQEEEEARASVDLLGGSCPQQVAGLCQPWEGNGSMEPACSLAESLEASAQMADEPVVVIDKGAGCTLLKLRPGATSADLHLPSGHQLLVNSNLVDSRNYPLRMGDVVQAMDVEEQDEPRQRRRLRAQRASRSRSLSCCEAADDADREEGGEVAAGGSWYEDDSWRLELDPEDVPRAEEMGPSASGAASSALSIDFEREKLGRIVYGSSLPPSAPPRRQRGTKPGRRHRGKSRRQQSFDDSSYAERCV